MANSTREMERKVRLLPQSIVIVCALLLALTACEPAETTQSKPTDAKRDKIKLKLAHGWPKGFPSFATSVDDYAALVEKLSDGDIQIRVDSRNKHKSAFGIFDFVKSGQYDIGQTASYYYGGKDPDALFFSSMPFDMTAKEQLSWFYHGGGLELANEVYDKHGIEVLPGGNTDMQMGGWFSKEISTIDDLKGLKMRIPGFAGKVMAKVGAVPTNIPAGELYQALERGTIDALEWTGPDQDFRMGFHKIANYYYVGWHEPGTELLYFFNKEKMASLPEWAQAILKEAATLTAYKMSSQTFDANATAWQGISENYPNVTIKNFPPEVLASLAKANDELIAEEVARSDVAKRIIESRAAYLKKARGWSMIGEQAYLNSFGQQQ